MEEKSGFGYFLLGLGIGCGGWCTLGASLWRRDKAIGLPIRPAMALTISGTRAQDGTEYVKSQGRHCQTVGLGPL